MFRLKHGGLILGMVFIFLLFFYFAVPAEDQALDSLVTTGPNILLDEWRAAFRLWANLGVFGALLSALLWFFLGQWASSLNHWAKAGKRKIWLALLGVSLLLAAPGVVLTPATQEWGDLAKVFYVGNNLLVYYLATLLCSPPSYKYTPYGAAAVRYW
jgi:hypothetical protein